MMKDYKTLVSACIDGEADEDEVLQCLEAIRKDPELERYWAQCCALTDVQHQRFSFHPDSSFTQRIWASIDTSTSPSQLVTLKSKRSSVPSSLFSRRWLPLAMAASVAAMAIVYLEGTGLKTISADPALQVSAKGREINVADQRSSISKIDEPLATLDNRIAVDNEGNLYLADQVLDRNELVRQRLDSGHLPVSRVKY
ncbi:MAG: hypothetical protein D6698_10205 [Gammaproteobacteria bacterium]|nr:MAG: hypothetical protein D6698_10205 [Gammaproteobacteria bacterium]